MIQKIVISGSSGRMGRVLLSGVLADENMSLYAALDAEGSPSLGEDAGVLCGLPACGVTVSNALADLDKADCLIDFTRPQGSIRYLQHCSRKGVSAVVGTTGFSVQEQREVEAYAKIIPIVQAPNMAVGVNVVFNLLEEAAQLLPDGYDVEVLEAHHRYKVDAPSGTALHMGRIIADAMGLDLADAVFGRQGYTGARGARQIGFSAIRGGDIVGDHTVMYLGDGERIEITHKTANRKPYVNGSLLAARFLADRPAGLYSMHDVLSQG